MIIQGKAKNRKENETFMLLSCIAIIMVVDCHTSYSIGILSNIFPYNSFFIALFVFISGYFYNNERNILQTCKHETVKMMIPYYMYNLFYGGVYNILKYKLGFSYSGADLNLYTLFVVPFISGVQFVFNGPAWFVPQLYLVKILYKVYDVLSENLLKLVLPFKLKAYDLLMALVFSLLNIFSVFVCQKHNQGYGTYCDQFDFVVFISKLLFLMCFYHIGKCFNRYWEAKVINKPAFMRLSVCVVIYTINFLICKGKVDGGSIFTMGGFVGWPVSPLITGLTGILFWYTISQKLVPSFGKSEICKCISNNTDSIMYNHVFIFNLINWGIVVVLVNILHRDEFIPFSELIKENAYAFFHSSNILRVPYVCIAVICSVFIGALIKDIMSRFDSK